MRVELFFALRLLRDARTQSVLIGVGAAVGVAVIIFLTALISGLQQDLIARTVGGQSHLSVEPAIDRPRTLWRTRQDAGLAVISSVEKTERRPGTLDNAAALLQRLQNTDGVRAAAPVCAGPATATRGAMQANVALSGFSPQAYQQVVELRARLTDGQLAVAAREAVVGDGLAEALGLRVGDRFRVQAAGTAGEVLQVRGTIAFGVQRLDDSAVLVSLRDAQSLLGLAGGVTGIEVAVEEIYQAEAIAEQLRGATGLEVTSWMARNAELLMGLRSQSSSSALIQAFVLLAVAMGIASALVVSVVQRRREIGILRAMGLRRRLAQRVFLIQGALLGLSGAVLGSGLGAALVLGFRQVSAGADGMRLFPIELSVSLFLMSGAVAVVTGLLAAVFPAHRAASLDPAVAIRND